METGILYVVFNKWIRDPETNGMPYKIGITKGSVYDRYYGLGLKMPGKFETRFAYRLDDCAKAELSIHHILNKKRENGEWFNLNDDELDYIEKTCKLMEGILVTDEVKNEIEVETEEKNEIISSETNKVYKEKLFEKNILSSVKPINPDHPCKVFIFSIGKALAGGASEYDGTRRWWRITEHYRDIFEYKFAVGLKDGISLGAYEIEKWNYSSQYDKCEFEGNEFPELKGFTWYRQIDVGSWKFGMHLVVEFDGNGKFRLLRPNKEDKWIDCL